jgi:hypothetical protein
MYKSQKSKVKHLGLGQHICTGCWSWQKAPAVDWLHGLTGPGWMLLIISDLLHSGGVGKK